MNNPYEQCPIFETHSFIIRLVSEEDAESLLACYSDPKAQEFFNVDNFPIDCRFSTLDEMLKYIKFWLREYSQEAYIRFAIVDKSISKAVGTIEMFGMVGQYKTDPGILRVDIASNYENVACLKEIFDICVKNFYGLFEVSKIVTKAPLHAVNRIQVLRETGFYPSGFGGREYYYLRSN